MKSSHAPSPLPALRLGIVPYINVYPLLEGLGEVFPEPWIRATPRELAGLLAAREIDVATLPTFEGLRAGGRYRLVPGAAIACDGPVRSVALYSRVPLEKIQSVLLDRASLTSSHLVRILAAELLHIEPRYRISEAPITATLDWQPMREDAFLVIGDAALALENKFPFKLDLGDGWKQLTGLPFVFAAWWVRDGLELSRAQEAAFAAARARGEAAAARIATRTAIETGASEADLLQYFTKAIRYQLGDREMEAIRLFEGKLAAHGLLANSPAARS